MVMTIDDSIMELEILKNNTFSYMSAHQAFITAIDTMRKYQKIREIAFPLQFCSTDKLEHEAIMKICEVVEDGIN